MWIDRSVYLFVNSQLVTCHLLAELKLHVVVFTSESKSVVQIFKVEIKQIKINSATKNQPHEAGFKFYLNLTTTGNSLSFSGRPEGLSFEIIRTPY